MNKRIKNLTEIMSKIFFIRARNSIVFMMFFPLMLISQGIKLSINEKPPFVKLAGKLGGMLDDDMSWSSKSIEGNTTLLMYIDPDNEKDNIHVEEQLLKEEFTRDQLQVYAVINMKASLLPNFAISMKLRTRQESNKLLQVVLDKKNIIQEQWGLFEQAYHVLLFNANGELLFMKNGIMNDNEIKELITLLKKNIIYK